MQNSDLRSFLDNFKASSSCVDFLSSLGFNVPYDGALIVTPTQIRADDHDPSFLVHHSLCHDFGTGENYDIIRLDMCIHNRSFCESVEALTDFRFTGRHAQFESTIASERKKLHDNIQKWHEILLTNPVEHRIAQDRDEGALDYLLDRKLTLDFIKKEKIGYNPDKKQIVFPYRKNGQIVYAVGRDFSGRAELPKDNIFRGDVKKYQKFFLTEGLDHCIWGLHTLHPKNSRARDSFYENPFEDNIKEDTLILCEGMVDTLVFAQNGWQVISGICGDFRKGLVPEVIDIARLYKRVFICFDNDGKGTEFQRKWARRLFEAQIPFICGHTAEAGAPKFDVADYYRDACNHHEPGQDEQEAGEQALQKLVRSAVPGIVEISQSLYSYERIADFLEHSARFAGKYDLLLLKTKLLQRTKTYTDPEGVKHEVPMFSKQDLNFLFQEAMKTPPEQETADEIIAHHTLTYSIDDSIYEFNGRRWEKKHDQFIRQYIYEALGRKAGDNRVSKVLKTLKTRIADDQPFDTQHVFTFSNGTLLLDENDEAGNRGRLVRSSPEHRATVSVDYRFIAGARNALWEQFISEVTCGNVELARELQKACGSILMADNSLHKLYYLIGDGRNGKSTLLNVLREVFGPDNGSAVRPDRMGEEFAPMALKGKLYNICFEGGKYLHGAEESLKSIVAGDPIMAAHKGVDAVEFTPRAKVFIAANNMFKARDMSDGFLHRFVFLPFENTFIPGDPSLTSRLLENLPGIFNWCLAGYRMLMEEGFIECNIQRRYRMIFEEHIEPLRVFLRETFTVSFMTRPLEDAVTYTEFPTVKALYKAYKDWALDSGYKCSDRGEFTDRLKHLAGRITRAPGLKPLRVDLVGCKECLIIPEMFDSIVHSSYAGADNIAHTEYISRLQRAEREEQEARANELSQSEEPSQAQAEITPSAENAPAERGNTDNASGTQPALYPNATARMFTDTVIWDILSMNEPQENSRRFADQYNDQKLRFFLRESGLYQTGNDMGGYAIAIVHVYPAAAKKMPLRLVLKTFELLRENPALKGHIWHYAEFEALQVQRIAARLDELGMGHKIH